MFRVDGTLARSHLGLSRLTSSHGSERDAVQAVPGNMAFRVYASREDETRVTVVHEWEDEASFAGYLGSDSFARSGEVLRPVMTGAPVSRRFRAELLETVA